MGPTLFVYLPVSIDEAVLEAIRSLLCRHGRDITLSYHRNCAALPCFAEFGRDCPNAERTANAVIYLPTYPRYAEAEIDKTVDIIRRYFAQA